jgi:hypothetical protein
MLGVRPKVVDQSVEWDCEEKDIGMIDCPHPADRLIEIPRDTVRWVSTPQWVKVGEEIHTESLPDGMRVMQCSECKGILVEKGSDE